MTGGGVADVDEFFEFRRLLLKHDVQVWSVVDQMNLTGLTEGDYFRIVAMAIGATKYVEQMAEKNILKMIEMAKHGWAATGNAPYGTDLVCYPHVDLDAACDRVEQMAREQAFSETFTRDEMKGLWQRGFARWQKRRANMAPKEGNRNSVSRAQSAPVGASAAIHGVDTMVGKRLSDFDSDLCAYAVGNVRQYLCGVTSRPKPVGFLRAHEVGLLDFPNWFALHGSGSFAPVADHIWAGVFAQVEPVSLSDSEFVELVSVLADIPDRLARECVWVPYAALHARYVECLPDIHTGLARQTAEEWADASASFVARLCIDALSLADGVSAVGDWVRFTRRLHRALGASSSPPARSVKERAPTAQPRTAETNESVACDAREALRVTGLKKTKLYDLFHSGALKGYREGRSIRFYRSELSDYMRERENASAPQTAAPQPRKPRARAPAAGTQFKFL